MAKHYVVENLVAYDRYMVLSILPQTDGDMIDFWPGQYATLSIWGGQAWSPVRCLSFTNAPEPNGRLEFAFRLTGKFTSSLSQLQPGDAVRVQGPYGEFVLTEATPNPIMIAGGIGITPFMSMIRAAAQPDFVATLLYMAHSPADLVYYDELLALQKQLPGLQIQIFLSQLPRGSHQFLPGPLDQHYIADLLGDQAAEFDYFICGPDGMMKSITKQLLRVGADKDYIFTESFAASSTANKEGYTFNPAKVSYVLAFGAFMVLVGAIAFKDVGHKLALARPQTTSQSPAQTPSQAATTPTSDSTNTTDTTSPSSVYSQPYRQPVSTVS